MFTMKIIKIGYKGEGLLLKMLIMLIIFEGKKVFCLFSSFLRQR